MLNKPAIVHFKKLPYDVYIGRPSIWGNPFSRKPGLAKYHCRSKAEALIKHKDWVLANPDFMQQIKEELKGKVLGCWCDSPYACHGFILWKIANDIPLDEKIKEHPTLF